MGKEYSIEITRAKLNSLFRNIRKLDGAYNLLARKLRISSSSLDSYLKEGKLFLEEYKDKLPEDFFDIDIEFIEDDFDLRREDIKKKFMLKEDINAFEVYFYGLREKAKEEYIYKTQKDIIENIEFSDIEALNEKIKLLTQF